MQLIVRIFRDMIGVLSLILQQFQFYVLEDQFIVQLQGFQIFQYNFLLCLFLIREQIIEIWLLDIYLLGVIFLVYFLVKIKVYLGWRYFNLKVYVGVILLFKKGVWMRSRRREWRELVYVDQGKRVVLKQKF